MRLKWKLILGAATLWLAPAVGLCAANDLSKLNVYPNPVRRYLGNNSVTLDGLTAQCRIRIYTSRGVLILDQAIENSSGTFLWDLRNASGQDVASGHYVYLISNDAGERRTGKIGVIR